MINDTSPNYLLTLKLCEHSIFQTEQNNYYWIQSTTNPTIRNFWILNITNLLI